MYFSGSTIRQTPCKIDYCVDKLVSKTGQTLSSKSLYFIRMGSFTYTDRNISIILKYMVLYIKPNPWAFLVSPRLVPAAPLQNHVASPGSPTMSSLSRVCLLFFCTLIFLHKPGTPTRSKQLLIHNYFWLLIFTYFLILRL